MKRAMVAVVMTVLVAGCTSTWEHHQQLVAQRTASGDYEGAVAAQKWLVDNSFLEAPTQEKGPRWDAARMMELGDLQGKAGQNAAAIATYRDILLVDPTQVENVLVGIGMLDLPEDKRNALMDEIVQNVQVIDQRVLVGIAPTEPKCFSYVAHEIRIRQRDRTMGGQGFEHQVTYDARPWVYDVAHGTWRADGEWIADAGSETQKVNGPPNPKYQAVLDADGGFYVDGGIPTCHAGYWRGPYDQARHTTYVARHLPGA
jgi:hypothetical protein